MITWLHIGVVRRVTYSFAKIFGTFTNVPSVFVQISYLGWKKNVEIY